MKKRALLAVAILGTGLAASGEVWSREESTASLLARMAELGRLEILRDGKTGPDALPAGMWPKYNEQFYGLQKEPLALLLPAIDTGLRSDKPEEFIGAATIYSLLVEQEKTPANPAYQPILLDRLEKDDLHLQAYTQAIVGPLLFDYRSRASVVAIMALAGRSPTREMKALYTKEAASMVGVWLDIYTNSTDEAVDKELARFEAWFAKHKDQISFDRKGKFHLSRAQPVEKSKTELDGEDRARIRENAACVLRLGSLTLSDAGDEAAGEAEAAALNARCGPALFGTERSARMGKMAETAKEGGSASAELEVELRDAADYPTPDALLLAAACAASYEKDPEMLRLAREMLIRASRDDIRRVTKGEPSAVRKKAESLAGERP